jgi:2,3-bisphosphoglycerate-dependent phosphoglycerate mutase
VIGSHGTAISAIIHYYDHQYGIEHFNRIRNIMPFVARLEFENVACKSINIFDILGDTEQRIYDKMI